MKNNELSSFEAEMLVKFFVGTVLLTIGILFGLVCGVEIERNRVIEANAGEYRYHPQTGEKSFIYFSLERSK